MPKTKLEKSMSLLAFEPENSFADLTENDKKDLYSWCSAVFSNPLFEKLFNEVYTAQVLDTLGKLENHDFAIEGRGQIFGIAGVKECFQKYHNLYRDMIKKDEKMTTEEKQEII